MTMVWIDTISTGLIEWLSSAQTLTFPGGAPLRAGDGAFIGAVGVSGGSPDQDADIARAAAAAL